MARKIGNIFYLKQDTFFYKKMYVDHFYPNIPTGLQSGLQYYLFLYLDGSPSRKALHRRFTLTVSFKSTFNKRIRVDSYTSITLQSYARL